MKYKMRKLSNIDNIILPLKNNMVMWWSANDSDHYWVHSEKYIKDFKAFGISGGVDRLLLKTFPFIKYEKMLDVERIKDLFIQEILRFIF